MKTLIVADITLIWGKDENESEGELINETL
jgi:hypothetical protein